MKSQQLYIYLSLLLSQLQSHSIKPIQLVFHLSHLLHQIPFTFIKDIHRSFFFFPPVPPTLPRHFPLAGDPAALVTSAGKTHPGGMSRNYCRGQLACPPSEKLQFQFTRQLVPGAGLGLWPGVRFPRDGEFGRSSLISFRLPGTPVFQLALWNNKS